MSWYSEGAEAAEQLAKSTNQVRRTKNFFTKPGESAIVRFLSPASESFNYKRAFVKWAKGEKMLTSPQTVPDPFVEAGLSLQAAFAWKVIDRRILKFKDQQTGEEKEVGPRVLYFADGQRTRKQLIAFEREMLESVNEERAEDGKEPLTLDQFNLTSYDLKVSKEKGAPWNFVAKRPKALSKADEELIEKYDFNLAEDLKPLESAELRGLLKGAGAAEGNGASSSDDEEETVAYSYSDDEDDTIKFEE